MAEPAQNADPMEEDVEETKEAAEVTDLSNSDVTTKYQEASKIANLALQGVVQQCVANARVNDLCKFGDTVIEQRCAQIFRSKVKGVATPKGIAFPTCVSVNECVTNNSPLESEASKHEPLKAGDVVKIELGCHVDYYSAVVAHTVKVGVDVATPVTGPEADVMLAAYYAAEVAAKTIKAGNTNTQVTEATKKVADAYGVKFVSGTQMEQITRYGIAGKTIALCSEDKEKEVTFEANEVYGVNVLVSSGDGKVREQDLRTTVFKRNAGKSYQLKMKASRYLFNEVNTRFPSLPFSLRALEDEKQARLGVVECASHELLSSYPVMFAARGSIVAHFRCTVLLLPSGTSKVTGVEFVPAAFSSDKSVDAETQAILDTVSKKKNRNKKKKKAGAAAGETKAMEEA
ncbi:conserved unknown protein [Ectocarpus siliculosus]|uniref:Peptidase M24 domain-containing protein n=1 Tax=Ectocarpus siliculosus TaxID=2880 RepID=D7FVN0_ECTSI|nr:conserved unknown protein [Ectocarpus siliculosus]|eukprot:CBJ31951.1 conserved unknown protein [Ectocarpus siliculosus]